MQTPQAPATTVYIWFPIHTVYLAAYVFIHAVLSGWISPEKWLIFAKISI